MDYKVIFRSGSGVNGADLLVLEGLPDIRNIKALKNSIQGKISKSHALEVKVKKGEKFDFSFIQLLAALRIKYTEEQKSVIIEIDTDEENMRILTAAGFSDFLPAKN